MKYHLHERNNVYFSSKSSKWLRFASYCACFEAKNAVHYIRRVKCNENRVQTTKYHQQKWNKAQVSSKSSKWLQFASYCAYFEAKNGLHYIRRVRCNENSVQTMKYHLHKRNNVYFSSKSSKWLRFASCCACFDAKNGLHYIRRVRCNENSVQTMKYHLHERNNVYFSSKSSKWLRFASCCACFAE